MVLTSKSVILSCSCSIRCDEASDWSRDSVNSTSRSWSWSSSSHVFTTSWNGRSISTLQHISQPVKTMSRLIILTSRQSWTLATYCRHELQHTTVSISLQPSAFYNNIKPVKLYEFQYVWLSEKILNGMSAQLGYTVSFTLVHMENTTDDKLKIQTIHRRNTTQTSKQHKTQQNKTTQV